MKISRLVYPLIQTGTVLVLLLTLAEFSGQLQDSQDIQVYERIGTDARLGHTLDSEYPPLTSAVFMLLSLQPFGLSFTVAWPVFLAILMVITVLLIEKLSDQRTVAWSAAGIGITMLLLGPEILFSKYDILIGLLLLLTWVLQRSQKYGASGCTVLIASCIKLVPILLWPLLLLMTPPKKRLRFLCGSVIGAVAGTIIPLLLLGPKAFMENVLHLLRYHSERGIQIESTWSGIHLLIAHLRGMKADIGFVAMSAQNMSLNGPLVWIASACVLLGVAFFAWYGYKRNGVDAKNPELFSALFLATLSWILAASPILSPQYLVWLLPMLIVWFLQSIDSNVFTGKRTIVFSALIVFAGYGTQWIWPLHYGAFLDQSDISLNVIHMLRNLSLVFLPVALLLHLHKKPQTRKIKHLPPLTQRTRRQILLWSSAGLVIGLFGVMLLSFFAHPKLSQATYGFPSTTDLQTSELPILITSQNNESLQITFTMDLLSVHPSVFNIKPDDCLNALIVNGQNIPVNDHCNYGSGKPFAIGSALQPGINRIQMEIGDSGGMVGVAFETDHTDPLLIAAHVLLLVLILAFAGALIFLRYRSGKGILLPVIFTFGLLLRVLYVLVTPFEKRGHDTDAHIDYIRYFADHLRIPAAQAGWEFHQPPLYYAITGLWMKAATWLHIPTQSILNEIQFFSLLLSVLCLACAWWIARLLFTHKDDSLSAGLFLGVIAVFPSLIFVAARISNDTLYQFLCFLFMALLIRWWQKPTVSLWFWICALVGIALITKVSATIFVPVLFLCLLFRRAVPWKKKILWGAAGTLLIFLLCGWLFGLRFFLEADTSRTMSLGNQGMNSSLSVQNGAENFLTFNPLQILAHPYNNPWDDAERRQYFWEYFFRSSLTGEFEFPDSIRQLNVGMILLALFSLVLILMGLIRSLHKKEIARVSPLLLLILFLLLSSFMYRFRYAYSANQDFRFVVMLCVPLAYIATQSITLFPKRFCIVPKAILLLFILLCAFFFISLAFVAS